MKAVIFPEKYSAMKWDYHHNNYQEGKLKGNVTAFKYSRVPLADTTTLTKAEHAELFNIPATITDEEGNTIDNPRYTELEDSYTLNKYALIVNNDLNKYDDEGNVIGYGCKHCGEAVDVVEITEDMTSSHD